MTPPLVLTFAPSDPSGGGGIQADLLTCASMGCQALTVLTGLTVQDSAGIEDSQEVDPEWIDDQARSLLEDMPVRAFKIGGMFSPEAVSTIAEILADYSAIPVVLHLGSDPLETQDAEAEDSAEEILSAALELLVPQATLVVVDAMRLRQWVADGLLELESSSESGVQALLRLGAGWVLTTGLHLGGENVVNTLTGAGESPSDVIEVEYRWIRLPGNFRGAGNTLSAALAAMMAGGVEAPDAAAEAQEYTWQALSAGFQPGMGRILPDRFFWARQPDRDGGHPSTIGDDTVSGAAIDPARGGLSS
ncbi:bifunctional hydroxymethylpyrimidine kinase/phosphomethylpyrimidine kinase [Pigmentiphaga litoralis]|uniref:hydroxymethylpyrimidine kinase n=1 Tax=Pigmentiphaga litoralis TaxID=516702 RepID=A0A7Y9LL30_9BURK|nr:hydroxymethylpyrimidine/phosphomethylpyrimidine kinase [Pigmentiphaga litoralis]NYE24259.1 hydroxymethylpyrimidine/phosphomethylpyrimidine kinase [Pigmentiphaga litoralis]NYE82127.1 hydroxymethylpyrimidine/phosphomethylpyrimidine kinase [Pigmentiphaga litoralis]